MEEEDVQHCTRYKGIWCPSKKFHTTQWSRRLSGMSLLLAAPEAQETVSHLDAD